MKIIEQFAELASYKTVESWRDQVFRLSNDLGYERSLLAILPDRDTPIETGFAFLHSSYPDAWRKRYDAEKFGYIDPTVSHCMNKSVPLIWTPRLFSSCRQNEFYEEACGHGIRSGVTLPIHGGNGELGILCFVSDTRPGKRFREDVARQLPELTCLRDFIFETSLWFTQPEQAADEMVTLSRCELECLKWCAAGKSSWDTSRLLNCSAAAVNFHFTNIRRKFRTPTRRQAVLKAIRLGILDLQ